MHRRGELVSYDGPERRGSIDRTLGEHGARLSAIESSVKGIADDVKALLADKNQAEGSKRTIYTVAAILGSIGGAAATYAAKLFK